MQRKKILNVIGSISGVVALTAFCDFVCAMYEKSSRDNTLIDIHYEMTNLQDSHHNNMIHWSKESETENKRIESRLAQLKAKHKKLEEPSVETVFFGNIPYKCPKCSKEKD